MNRINKTNIGWTHLLDDPQRQAELETLGHTHISAQDMRNLFPDSPDPRLMIKFDTPEERPQVFKERGLSLWPLSHGEFAIVKSMTPYIAIDTSKIAALPIERMRTKSTVFAIQSIDGDRCSSETDLMRMLNDSGTIRNIHDAEAGEISFSQGRKYTQDEPMNVTFKTDCGPVELVSDRVRLESDAQHESNTMVTTMELKILKGRGFERITGVHARQVVFGHHSIQARLNTLGSDKQLDSYVLLAQKPNRKNPNWEIAVLRIDIDVNREEPWVVDWDRSYKLIHNRTTDTFAKTFARKKARKGLAHLERFAHNADARFPQWNRIDVILQVMTDLGKQGAADIIDDLSIRTAKMMRQGKTVRLTKNQMDDVSEVPLALLLEGFAPKDTWSERQENYLVNALNWMGMVEQYDANDKTLKPSARCLAMAHCAPSVQTQQLWNIMMSSPVMQAIAHEQPITMDMRKAEGLENESVFERRVSAAKPWIKTLRARMMRYGLDRFDLQDQVAA